MLARGVVRLEVEDRPSPVGDEVLARSREEPIVMDAGVFGAVVLVHVRRSKREEVGALPATDVDDLETVVFRELDPPSFAGGDVNVSRPVRHQTCNVTVSQ